MYLDSVFAFLSPFAAAAVGWNVPSGQELDDEDDDCCLPSFYHTSSPAIVNIGGKNKPGNQQQEK